jgi:hypothetical protein
MTTNTYGTKTFHVSGANPISTQLTVFDFATDGPGGTAVTEGIVYVIATIAYKDSDDQRGFTYLDQAFQIVGGVIRTIGGEFFYNIHGESNFSGVGYGYDTLGSTAVIIDVNFGSSSPTTGTHDFYIETYLTDNSS